MAPTIRLPREPTPSARSHRRLIVPRRSLLPILLILFTLLVVELHRLNHRSPNNLPPSSLQQRPQSPLDLPPPPFPNLKTLLLVPCHGTYLSGPPVDDSSWALDEFSKSHHRGATFAQHISTAVNLATNGSEPSSLLVFSGGETRVDAGSHSEAAGYRELAERYVERWSEIEERAVTEDHAADSWENLVFSICRFFELVGRWPERIVVVGFTFKEERFTKVHREMAGWDGTEDKWRYVGVDPEWEDDEEKESVRKGEARAREMFKGDCRQPDLRKKRMGRRWGRRRDGYTESCPDYAGWLRRCETGWPEVMGEVPWR